MNKALCEQLERHRVEVNRLCQQYGVLRLELFGSATLERFDHRHSDLDFLVNFQDGCTSIDNYLPLAEGLERLFGRHVDLVIDRAIRNPCFRQAVNSTRRLIYEDRGQKAAA